MKKPNNFLVGTGLALLATLLWSGNYIVARGLHQEITPITLAFLRWSTATLFLFPIAIRQIQKQKNLLISHLKFLCLAALLGVTLFNTFIYIAGKYSSAMNLAIIGTTAAPIFVLILASFFLKEKASISQIIGTIVCIVGILLLISRGNFQNLSHFKISLGDIWILFAALVFAFYTILVRKKPKDISSISFLFSIFLLGTLFLLPAFIFDNLQGQTFMWSLDLILIFLYLGIGASIGAFLSWNIAIQKIGSAKTALFGNLIPVFSTIEAVVILKEENTWVNIISLVIILIGLLIANSNQLKKFLFNTN